VQFTHKFRIKRTWQSLSERLVKRVNKIITYILRCGRFGNDLLGDGRARSEWRRSDDSHEGALHLVGVFGVRLQDVVVHSGHKGGGLTNALLFARCEEGGMLGSLGEGILSSR